MFITTYKENDLENNITLEIKNCIDEDMVMVEEMRRKRIMTTSMCRVEEIDENVYSLEDKLFMCCRVVTQVSGDDAIYGGRCLKK